MGWCDIEGSYITLTKGYLAGFGTAIGKGLGENRSSGALADLRVLVVTVFLWMTH
jgi:hypothetical protein